MDNTGDRKSVRAKEKASRLVESQRAAVIVQLMSTAAGREWLWNILTGCHCFSSTFNGDALQSAFHEGQRATGLSILADILTTCPDQYIQAMREANERSSLDERRRSAQPDGGDSGSGDPDDADPGAEG